MEELIAGIIWLAIIGFTYLLPAIVGRKKKNANAIFILNVLLGWTILGWIIALVWAVSKD